jgi:hypothetical protein
MPIRWGGGGLRNELLATGQTTCYAIGDDGDFEAGDAKAYTVNALPGTSLIEVAHYAGNGISFVAPNTVNDAGAGLVTILAADTIVVKGSALNDGVYTVLAGGVAGTFTTVQNTIVNELAGAVVSLYKRAALSNNVVQDDRTGLMWARYTSNGLRVGPASTGNLYWYLGVAPGISTLYSVANTVSVIMPGNIYRIVGGAALTQFHAGDCIVAAGFANAVNNRPDMVVVSATPNGANLNIVVDPGNQVMVAEGAVGDAIYLVCRSAYNYVAGANPAGLGGYTNWRLPNNEELISLANYEVPTAVPDAVAFPGWPRYVHTSTTDPSNTAWTQPFDYTTGTIVQYNKVSVATQVSAALVRGGA